MEVAHVLSLVQCTQGIDGEELEMRVGGVGRCGVRCDGLDVVLGYIVGKARQYATL